jgi:hypothetical protein
MAAEELRHLALPMLYGAPAYARPARHVTGPERPFDPDDLPLQAVMTDEERALLERGPVPALMSVEAAVGGPRQASGFDLRGLTGLIRGRRD